MSEAESVLVTGTTSGVGRALLEHYARRGARVVAVNRRRVPELEAAYPSVQFEHVDVRAADEVAALVARLAGTERPPRVFILNAGINRVDNDEAFELDAYRTVVDTNLYGALNFVAPLTTLERRGTARHVVAVSSMATVVGNPYGLGYTTSKQALSECFNVWSRMYAGTELVFQQVILGPVHTSIFTMDDDFPAWMVELKRAFSGTPEATAAAIARFARTRRPRLVYPRRAVPLYAGMRLGQLLVPGLFRGRKTLKGSPR